MTTLPMIDKTQMHRSLMLKSLTIGVFVLLALTAAQGQGAITLATRLSDVKIDGDLSDWPEDTPRIPMRNHFQAYGPTDLEVSI
jgi:hypothetical protein